MTTTCPQCKADTIQMNKNHEFICGSCDYNQKSSLYIGERMKKGLYTIEYRDSIMVTMFNNSSWNVVRDGEMLFVTQAILWEDITDRTEEERSIVPPAILFREWSESLDFSPTFAPGTVIRINGDVHIVGVVEVGVIIGKPDVTKSMIAVRYRVFPPLKNITADWKQLPDNMSKITEVKNDDGQEEETEEGIDQQTETEE